MTLDLQQTIVQFILILHKEVELQEELGGMSMMIKMEQQIEYT